MEYLSQHIESLIFSSERPITYDEIKVCLEETFESKFKKPQIEKAINVSMEKYRTDEFPFEIIEIGNGYRFFTKGAYHKVVGQHLKQTAKKRLSRAALETLSIVAYKQPVTKGELEKIRGVSCDYAIQKLLEKELVTIIGRSEGPGRPLLYSTSQKFMDYFGLKDLSDLPKPKDFKDPDQVIGEAAPVDELAGVSVSIEDQIAREVSQAIADAMELEITFEDLLTPEEIAMLEAGEQSEGMELVVPTEEEENDLEDMEDMEEEDDNGDGPIYVPIRAEGEGFESMKVVSLKKSDNNSKNVKHLEEE